MYIYMKNILIHHQGWGDLLTCHGLVRYNCNKYTQIVLLIRDDAKELCNYMYKDIIENGNLIMDYVPKSVLDNNIKNYINNKYDTNINLLIHGMAFDYLDPKKVIKNNRHMSFGHQFYENYGINSINRINCFEIIRDKNLEDNLYNKVINDIGKEYIVIHEDINRNIIINKQYINNNMPLYNLDGQSNKLFDMIKIIENAKEIHLIESTYSIMIYLLQQKYNLFSNIPIKMHSYTRNNRNIDLYQN